MYRQAGCLPKTVKRTLCQSLVQCHLGLCCIILVCCDDTKSPMQIANCPEQNRFILDLAPRTHLTVDHMKELNLLQVPDRAKQLRLNNAHKIFYNQAPGYLQEHFVKTRNRLQQHTRSSQWNFLMCLMSREMGVIHFILKQLKIGIVSQMTLKIVRTYMLTIRE